MFFVIILKSGAKVIRKREMGNPYKLGNPHFSKFEEKLKRLHPLGDPTKRNKKRKSARRPDGFEIQRKKCSNLLRPCGFEIRSKGVCFSYYGGGITNPPVLRGRTFFDGGLQIRRDA